MAATGLCVVVERHVKFANRTGIYPAVILCPSDMAAQGISFGEHVTLSLDIGTYLAVAWPFAKIAPGHCRLEVGSSGTLSSLTAGARLAVGKLGAPRSAASVTFTLASGVPLNPILQSALRQRLLGELVLLGSEVTCLVLSERIQAVPASIEPTPTGPLSPFLIDDTTRVSLKQGAASPPSGPAPVPAAAAESGVERKEEDAKGRSGAVRRGYSCIGGLESELAAVREVVELPLVRPDLFRSFGVRPPRGVLLYGPPGTGKTLIARSIAAEAFARMLVINGAELTSRYVGESESKLRAVFEAAREQAPCVIFIDELDALCPRREEATEEVQRRLVAALLTLMDGAAGGGDGVVVLGATNRVAAIDAALRRPGRFDREVEIGVPSARGRLAILRSLLRDTPLAPGLDGDGEGDDGRCGELEEIAGLAHGFVGADLLALCKEAALAAIQRRQSRGRSGAEGDEGGALLVLEARDLRHALSLVRPSALREVALDVPNVKWDDIGGQRDIKRRLQEAVEWPLAHPQAFLRLGVRPPKGILLYGPPGCSKTMMAKALATESSRNFIAVKGPELLSKWVGESEKAVKEVFRKARAAAPSIVFFDEIDSIATARSASGASDGAEKATDRVLSQLLVELDGIEPLKQVTVLAATNRPDILDKALLRPGRIDRILYVGPPDAASAAEIFALELKRMAHTGGIDTATLAAACPGLSGAEIAAVCRQAAMNALEAGRHSLDMTTLLEAARAFKPRITPDMIAAYNAFRTRSGLTAA